MILIRTTEFEEVTAEFARTLAEASGRDVAILADERKHYVDTGAIPKISINKEACREIGLFAPDDFAWRCGDYGFYLARRRFPEVESFWIIENDVRISAPRQFFNLTDAQPQIDLLATYVQAARSDWWWYSSASSRDVTPYRCLFPVVRLSAAAIDHLEHVRISHSRKLRRRLMWPNDEIFVATSVANANLEMLDLNILCPDLYESDTFSFDCVIDGDLLTYSMTKPKLYHSVLSGITLKAKKERVRKFTEPQPWRDRLIKKAVPHVNSIFRW